MREEVNEMCRKKMYYLFNIDKSKIIIDDATHEKKFL